MRDATKKRAEGRPDGRWLAVTALVGAACAVELSGAGPVAAAKAPICTAAQLVVKVGHTQSPPGPNTGVPIGSISVTPVRFTNDGGTCWFTRSGPVFRLSTGKPTSTVNWSVTSPIVTLPRITGAQMTHAGTLIVNLVVARVLASQVKACNAQIASYIWVDGYAANTQAARYFHHTLRHVCFDHSNAPILNVGAYPVVRLQG